jgi:2-oxoglutarate dehydrogenase E1 component
MTNIFSAYGSNSGYVADLYELYLHNPKLVGQAWQKQFEQIASTNGSSSANQGVTTQGIANRVEVSNGKASPQANNDLNIFLTTQEKISRLVLSYRAHGHSAAKIIPLASDVSIPTPHPQLDISSYDFFESVKNHRFLVDGLQGHTTLSVSESITLLQQIYCGSIGFEWDHLVNFQEREWLRTRIESSRATPPPAVRRERLKSLLHATHFESELHKKYIGVKRFSLEGGEALVPLLNEVLAGAAKYGVQEAVFGMAHRGRLNFITQVLQRPLPELLLQFDDRTLATIGGAGDVKYHLGYEKVREFTVDSPNGKATVPLKLRLVPNPSHLEAVNPVAVGICRALQDTHYETSKDGASKNAVMPVVVHGDAAIVGQGVVCEVFNYARVPGFQTNGTVHVVVNNQIGFTTTADESRSTTYCTDFAKAIGAPVFHVNGEDVDAVCFVAELAASYRNTFLKDVVVDFNCYRKHGHNEGDDPSYTQPLSSKEIKSKKNGAALYTAELVRDGVITEKEVEEIISLYRAQFNAAVEESKQIVIGDACPLFGRPRTTPKSKPAVTEDQLKLIAESMSHFPENFTPHPKLRAQMEKRVEVGKQNGDVDWGLGEALAFGTLLQEGFRIRLCGQDCRRGTFSHRHAVLDDFTGSGKTFAPLATCGKEGAFEVINSTLSEAGVLGFEFGYSSVALNSLVLWEAQFGDFINGAQIIIDQFLSSSESKWDQRSSVALLLPHGYEGQGPEHSSARPERFLQLCAEENMEVCIPTNSLQYYALLRRHMHRSSVFPRPLIVMMPKSLLRLTDASVKLEHFVDDNFREVLVTDFNVENQPKKIICCSGKVFYDIEKALKNEGISGVRLLRFEQLYPFPSHSVDSAIGNGKIHPDAIVAWVQEEPRNQGSWSYIEPYLREQFGLVKNNSKPQYIGRPAAASTAVGSPHYHALQLKDFLSRCVEFCR